jgi:hypothetical protein
VQCEVPSQVPLQQSLLLVQGVACERQQAPLVPQVKLQHW